MKKRSLYCLKRSGKVRRCSTYQRMRQRICREVRCLESLVMVHPHLWSGAASSRCINHNSNHLSCLEASNSLHITGLNQVRDHHLWLWHPIDLLFQDLNMDHQGLIRQRIVHKVLCNRDTEIAMVVSRLSKFLLSPNKRQLRGRQQPNWPLESNLRKPCFKSHLPNLHPQR